MPLNIVDYVIIGVVAISVLFGLYRGFVSSVLSMGGGLVSFLASFALYPKLAALIQNNQELQRTLLHYTDASSRIGDLELALTPVINLGREGIEQVLTNVSLPAPLDSILQVNLESSIFSNLSISTVGEYVNQTILQASINIICFLVCFAGLYIVISLGLNLLRAVFRFPVLKHMDALAGGAFGFLMGVVLCFVAFTILPLMESVVPIPEFRALVDESALAQVFRNGNLVISIMNRKL